MDTIIIHLAATVHVPPVVFQVAIAILAPTLAALLALGVVSIVKKGV
jgi:hypothetical protein